MITDMVMPHGVTGLELAERFRAQKPDLQIIISTGYSSDLLGQTGAASDGIAHLPKPCTPPQLATAVRSILDRQRARKITRDDRLEAGFHER